MAQNSTFSATVAQASQKDAHLRSTLSLVAFLDGPGRLPNSSEQAFSLQKNIVLYGIEGVFSVCFLIKSFIFREIVV